MVAAETQNTSSGPLLLHSARIFTGERLHPTATAVLISDGRIKRVGTDTELLPSVGPQTRVIDVNGGLVAPGFIDAHVHAVYGGLERGACDLTGAKSRDDTFDTVRYFVSANPPSEDRGSEWIFGGGWYTGYFPRGTPTASDLDALTGSRPAYLINADHHSAWVNTAALERAGINVDTADPPDGLIERDASGTPTGVLHEGAMDLMGKSLPAHAANQTTEGLKIAAEYLHSMGVTGWQEAILGDYAGYSDASESYRQARRCGILSETVSGALWVPRSTTIETVPEIVADLKRRRQENADSGFTTRTAKIMVDGVPENKTAAMLENYCRCESFSTGLGPPQAEDRGLTYLDRNVLLAVCQALDAADFDLHFHAIGDRAVRWALDAVEAIKVAAPDSRGRHHIAHIQIVHPEDIRRFEQLNVSANIQALWACNDPQMLEHTVPQLGSERTGWQYPFASIQRSGARLCMGSDWPVSTPDPWQAIHVAVNRTFPEELDSDVAMNSPLNITEALSLSQALKAYTAGSAWQLRLDGEYGYIETGAVADISVANRNPFDYTERHICKTRNILTIHSGKVIYDAR